MSPSVTGERETLRRIIESGCSISRFGDGEITLMLGGHSKGQEADRLLASRLCDVAICVHPCVMVAIPRIFGKIPKHKRAFWERYTKPERVRFFPPGRQYGSAFITRPDYDPANIGGAEYWALMRSIWQGRPVLFVRGAEPGQDVRKAELVDNAASVELMPAPPRDAWAEHGRLFAACRRWGLEHKDGVIVLCVGPTATVLAHDLGIAGHQALDLGHASNFYRNEMRTQPCAA